jgi:hypothetical protein
LLPIAAQSAGVKQRCGMINDAGMIDWGMKTNSRGQGRTAGA